MSTSPLALLLAAGVAASSALAAPAQADTEHPSIVEEDPADQTPQLVPTTTVEQPRADALARLDDTVYAGGWFDQVSQGDQTYNRTNVVAFDAATGAVQPFAPLLDGRVMALATDGESIYVGGEFTTVNGLPQANLVKVDASTGAVDPTFRPSLDGRVNALTVSGGRLFAGGAFSQKLAALDLGTGADTGYVDLSIADPIPNAWGDVAVYALAIGPHGDSLVATGNFQTVAGESRTRLFLADLGETSASLSPWYYDGFAEPCSSDDPRRIAYLQGVDFSPDGKYFVVTATGQVSRDGDLGRTVCDAAGRFDLSGDSEPAWINYTGGDSVWSASATGAAVYVQGHFRWLDNAGGWQDHPAPTAVERRGIGALDPATGEALPWDPDKPARVGGRAFLATSEGLWVGSDSADFAGESHRGLAFCPLP